MSPVVFTSTMNPALVISLSGRHRHFTPVSGSIQYALASASPSASISWRASGCAMTDSRIRFSLRDSSPVMTIFPDALHAASNSSACCLPALVRRLITGSMTNWSVNFSGSSSMVCMAVPIFSAVFLLLSSGALRDHWRSAGALLSMSRLDLLTPSPAWYAALLMSL